MQFRVSRGTDAGRITQANILTGGGEIEVELPVQVIRIAFEINRAAPGVSRECLNVDAIAREQKGAIEFSEATRHSGVGERHRWSFESCPAA